MKTSQYTDISSSSSFRISSISSAIARQYKPKTQNQELYAKYLKDTKYPIVFGIGPAGCGKTLFACIQAIRELNSNNIQKIILTRPIVPVEEEELGFLPGNLITKMDPWTRPIFDIFLEFYKKSELDLMIKTNVIEISPLAYMRGRTFKDCFIIADEMQNSSPNQMLMLTTRLGNSSKLVVTGDLKQSDRSESNGLVDIMQKVRAYDRRNNDSMIKIVEMNQVDVLRSPVVSQILKIYHNNTTCDDEKNNKFFIERIL
jgi:phosphate starvation-inducible PhoH-like protein